jgi:hypothetical protein
MKNSNTIFKVILGVLVFFLVIGIIALVLLLQSYYGKGPAAQSENEQSTASQTAVDSFPVDSPTKDTSKIIIQEVRNGAENLIGSVSLMIPQNLIGLAVEVNGISVPVIPVNNTTIRLELPADQYSERLEIHFKADSEIRSTCIINNLELEKPEGNCIW